MYEERATMVRADKYCEYYIAAKIMTMLCHGHGFVRSVSCFTWVSWYSIVKLLIATSALSETAQFSRASSLLD